MAADFPSDVVVRDYGSLVDALRIARISRQISNEVLEELAGLCKGHVDKLLGISQEKRIGPTVLGLLCDALGVEFVMRPNPDAMQRLAHRWQKRNSNQDHSLARQLISKAALDRCRPIILSEMARKGWQTRRAGKNGHNGNGHRA